MRHSLSGPMATGGGGSSLPSFSELVRQPALSHPIGRDGEEDSQRKKMRLE